MRNPWEALKKRLVRLLLAIVGFNVNVLIDVHDANTGALLHHQELHNLVVDAGLNLIRDWLCGKAPNFPDHFAVGTGTTAVSASDTTLATEVYRDALTQADNSTTKQATFKYYLPSTQANGDTLAEIGLFNASSGGAMFARALLASTIAKTSSIAVTFTWVVSLGAS